MKILRIQPERYIDWIGSCRLDLDGNFLIISWQLPTNCHIYDIYILLLKVVSLMSVEGTNTDSNIVIQENDDETDPIKLSNMQEIPPHLHYQRNRINKFNAQKIPHKNFMKKMNKKENQRWYILSIFMVLCLIIVYQATWSKNQDQQRYPEDILINNKQLRRTEELLQKKRIQQSQKEVQNVIEKMQKLKQQKKDIKNLLLKEDTLPKQLRQVFQISKFYDIHYFVEDEHIQKQPKPLLKATDILQKPQPRRILTIAKTPQQLQQIMKKMMNPSHRSIPAANADKKQIQMEDLAYFYYEISKQQQNQNYRQIQFYRLNKYYNIGEFGKQLPLCVVATGKNSGKSVERMYQSIQQQNYTNYRVVHIDDHSQDATVQKVMTYLKDKTDFRQKVTLFVQQYQRNTLFNCNLAIMNYCHEDDIVVDMGTDDWLIGTQVFQLINTLYQQGNIQNGKKEELWSAVINSIGTNVQQNSLDISRSKQIKPTNFRYQSTWRAPHLNTYLRKFYLKIDKSEFIDNLMTRQRQFYAQKSSRFIQAALIQMSTPKHIKYVNQFLYYHNKPLDKRDILQTFYATAILQSLLPYKPLQSIESTPKRDQAFKPSEVLLRQLKQRKSEIELKRKALKFKVYELLNSEKPLQFDPTILERIQIKKVMNKENEGKNFGKQEQFYVSVKELGQPNRIKDFDYSAYGIETSIQVGSVYDYINFSRAVNFTDLQERLFKAMAHETLSFRYNKTLDTPAPKIQYKQFRNEQQIQKFIDGLDIRTPTDQKINNVEYYIGTKVVLPYIDQMTRELEYYYTNKKYEIGNIKTEVPICVFSSSYKLFSQNRYQKFFQSIEKLNYTNYKILWVDDYSPDNSAYQVYEYLRKSDMKLKNKIKIIHNLQHLGIMGNMHMYIKHYCGQDDIVLIVDGDDSLIGTQLFQILNAVYQNPDYWFVYTRFFLRDPATIKDYQVDQYSMGLSTAQLTIPADKYRTHDRWVTSHLRTFRKKVMDAVPLQHFIEYHYDKETELAFPRYYGSSADRFQVYSNLQVAGLSRIHYITDFLYNYDYHIPQYCYRRHEVMDQLKCKLKTPIKPLGPNQKTAKYLQNYTVPEAVLQKLKKVYPQHSECKKKMGWD